MSGRAAPGCVVTMGLGGWSGGRLGRVCGVGVEWKTGRRAKSFDAGSEEDSLDDGVHHGCETQDVGVLAVPWNGSTPFLS